MAVVMAGFRYLTNYFSAMLLHMTKELPDAEWCAVLSYWSGEPEGVVVGADYAKRFLYMMGRTPSIFMFKKGVPDVEQVVITMEISPGVYAWLFGDISQEDMFNKDTLEALIYGEWDIVENIPHSLALVIGDLHKIWHIHLSRKEWPLYYNYDVFGSIPVVDNMKLVPEGRVIDWWRDSGDSGLSD